jgi:DNA topoisomerase-6 subunit B
VLKTSWRAYGLSQSSGALPVGPCTLAIHIASVWVPYTSESKEAIAHYPEIIKEIKLALQEIGRDLGSYIHKKRRVGDELKKRSYIEKYIPYVIEALREILKLKKTDEMDLDKLLNEILEKHRGKLDDVEFKPDENTEFDEEFAKIGKGEDDSDE